MQLDGTDGSWKAFISHYPADTSRYYVVSELGINSFSYFSLFLRSQRQKSFFSFSFFFYTPDSQKGWGWVSETGEFEQWAGVSWECRASVGRWCQTMGYWRYSVLWTFFYV